MSEKVWTASTVKDLCKIYISHARFNGAEESGAKNAREILTGTAMKKCFDRISTRTRFPIDR